MLFLPFLLDIVGFTKISSELEPRKIANMLDRLYTKFDGLSQEHDIFKVETIGDAYMAVTNLVKDQPGDHASRIANFAVDAIEAANETLINEDDPFMGHVDIRVGFHTGPVVADVVGSKNPRYCLFGDTVNTASRMESNSKKNRIHCSQAALDQLRIESYPLPIASRGFINVKGKGNMATYWVNEAGLPAAAIPLSTVPEDDLTESERFISSLSNHNHHLVPPMPPRQVKPQRRASTR
ncbi:Receptor-type guanylate cyclase gcy [Seminavis robusta]|uniref:Receptor-type guanylate cyclase gcy n=1 Tax=Seminavis robusta TaxID=568900 RepID=A0A9N8ER35_9STRA|nr:Receptor-type guanylate cyclase gcy [Seminavis robusta]|eukprot:Sro1717_g293270.1 Receptor-type guanylate cyclase gcy (238) ;mRNA; f:20185-21411